MKTKIFIVAFIILFFVQLGVGLNYVCKNLSALSEGAPIKFKCRPIDPYDMFRGRYVRLNLENLETSYTTKIDAVEKMLVKNKTQERLRIYNTSAYVKLGADAEGFAKIESYAPEYNAESGDVINMRCASITRNAEKQTEPVIAFVAPITKFFMNENDAPLVETEMPKIMRDNNRRAETYIVARLKGDDLVIENLYLDGKPYKEFLKDLTVENAEKSGEQN